MFFNDTINVKSWHWGQNKKYYILFLSKKFVSYKKTSPVEGFQREYSNDGFKNEGVDLYGYCEFWNYFFIECRITYPDMLALPLQKKITKSIKNTEKNH